MQIWCLVVRTSGFRLSSLWSGGTATLLDHLTNPFISFQYICYLSLAFTEGLTHFHPISSMSTDSPSSSFATVRSLHLPAPSSNPPSRPLSPTKVVPASTIEASSSSSTSNSSIEPAPLESHFDVDEDGEVSSDDSVSSFPSITSSFFFSSAAASPPHFPVSSSSSSSHHLPHGHSKLPQGEDAGLIIPSLELPAPLKRPKTYGESIGDVRVVVVGTGCRELVDELLVVDEEEDGVIVDSGMWTEEEYVGSVRRASTFWEDSGRGKGNIVFVAVDDWDDSVCSSPSTPFLSPY